MTMSRRDATEVPSWKLNRGTVGTLRTLCQGSLRCVSAQRYCQASPLSEFCCIFRNYRRTVQWNRAVSAQTGASAEALGGAQ
jgi:hypothetical protein